MMVDPFTPSTPVPVSYGIGPSGDVERSERFPDNEAAEVAVKAKAPLEPYQGTKVDVEA